PAPGGGSVAALAGALGSALAAMVGNLGAKRASRAPDSGRRSRGDTDQRAIELGLLAEKAQAIKEELLGLVDEDTRAFDAVLEAMRLPKSSEAEILARMAAMETATLEAAETPLRSARACLAAMELCLRAVEIGNPSSITDGAAGCIIANAGLEGAILNVRVNLGSLPDASRGSTFLAEAARLEAKARDIIAELRNHAGLKKLAGS
ncbi:MAG TPA: cyclodeaminase/cyclohydrolase family protein, partial [Rectinemataceae bacterium]